MCEPGIAQVPIPRLRTAGLGSRRIDSHAVFRPFVMSTPQPHLFLDQAPQQLFLLQGKVVLLTGAAGGIALGLAKAFAVDADRKLTM